MIAWRMGLVGCELNPAVMFLFCRVYLVSIAAGIASLWLLSGIISLWFVNGLGYP